jgi:predicted O-methyltransferase YrrM
MRNLHTLIINDKYDVGGLCLESKGNVIKELINTSNAKLCVEIGVFKGSSLLYFAESLQDTGGKVIGIDPYQLTNLKNDIPDKVSSHLIYNVLFTEQKVLDEIHSKLIEIVEDNNLNNLIEIVRDTSENYYHNLNVESIDVLHIDGNHDEEYVTKDIVNYLPLVKRGGYILMDDITWDGVKNSINNHLKDHCDLVSNHVDFAVYIKK